MSTLLDAVAGWGWIVYVAAFLLVMIESIGVPIPALSFVMLAAGLAGAGNFSVLPLYIVTIAAGVVGGQIGYSIGAGRGTVFLDRYSEFLRITPKRRRQAENYVRSEGKSAVLFGRYMPVFCFAASPLSGVAGMQYRQFSICNLVGIILWTIPSVTLAFYFGRSFETLSNASNVAGVLLLLAVIGISYVLFVRRLQKRIE